MPRSKPHLSDPAASSADGAGRSGYSLSMDMLEILAAARAVMAADVHAASAPILLDGKPPLGGDGRSHLQSVSIKDMHGAHNAPKNEERAHTARPAKDKGASATFEGNTESDRQVRKRDCAPADRPPSRRRSHSELAVREENSPPPPTGLGSQLPPAISEASRVTPPPPTPRPSKEEAASVTIKESPETDHQVRKADQPPADRPPLGGVRFSEHAVREENSAREENPMKEEHPAREIMLPQKRPRGTMCPATKRTFLEALSRTGNVRGSAYYAQISHEAAYQARRRDAAFACAWDGALVIARDMAQDELTDKAMNGITEDIVYHGEVTASRTRFDGRLLLALLARLDKHAEDNPAAMRGAARFDALLERIGAGVAADDLLTTPIPAEQPWRHGEGGRGGAVGAADPALEEWLAAQQEGG